MSKNYNLKNWNKFKFFFVCKWFTKKHFQGYQRSCINNANHYIANAFEGAPGLSWSERVGGKFIRQSDRTATVEYVDNGLLSDSEVVSEDDAGWEPHLYACPISSQSIDRKRGRVDEMISASRNAGRKTTAISNCFRNSNGVRCRCRSLKRIIKSRIGLRLKILVGQSYCCFDRE